MTENKENVAEELAIKNYEKSESKSDLYGIKNASIFLLNLEDLTYEKMYLQFEKLAPAQYKLDGAKVDMQVKKDKLLLETDWKKEYPNESRITNAIKDAHMKPLLESYVKRIDYLQRQITFYTNKISIVSELIRNRRLELKIENSLLEEE